jgi:dipeptidyl aminopeptidase/acylaminoacyl peptidase
MRTRPVLALTLAAALCGAVCGAAVGHAAVGHAGTPDAAAHLQPAPASIAFDDSSHGVFLVTPGHPGSEHQIPQSTLGENPTWSPDGQRLAFVTPDGTGGLEIKAVTRAGTHPTTLLSGATAGVDGAIAWSPDGKEIAYACDGATRSSDDFVDQLCLLHVGSGKHSLVTSASNQDALTQTANGLQRLSWAPNGRTVAATVDHPTACAPADPPGTFCHQSDIGLVTVATGSYHLLTGHYATAPAFSPDGRNIVYDDPVAAHGEPTGVVVMTATGTHAHSIVAESKVAGDLEEVESDPVYSPNGKQILYAGASAAGGTGAAQLFEIAANGGSPTRWTDHSENVTDPAWTPALTVCAVPNLKHDRLAKARHALARAHCRLGKVRGPHRHRNRLRVVAQSPKPHAMKPTGTRVRVRVG